MEVRVVSESSSSNSIDTDSLGRVGGDEMRSVKFAGVPATRYDGVMTWTHRCARTGNVNALFVRT